MPCVSFNQNSVILPFMLQSKKSESVAIIFIFYVQQQQKINIDNAQNEVKSN